MLIVQHVHNTTCTHHHLYTHAHHTIFTQHHMYNMHETPHVHRTAYPTCTQHHLYTTLHMPHSHNTIYTILYITLHKQHVHTVNIHHITCKKHHKCNMYDIYTICTTLVPHIQNHIVLTKKTCFQCLIHAYPNMSQTTLSSFH